MTLLAALLLLALLVAAGSGLLALGAPRPPGEADGGAGDPAGPAGALALAGGLLVLEVSFLAAHLTGIPWSLWTAMGPLLALGAAPLALRRGSFGRPRLTGIRPLPRPGIGDATALAALGLFAGLTATGWLIFPDLVYHWGIKAGKFALHGGLDLELLTGPVDFVLHPDYPILLPALVATTSLFAGASQPAAGMVWGPILALAVWLAGRRWLAARVESRITLQAGTAALGLYLTFHAVAFRRATDAGWFLALALLLAAPVLERSGRPREGSADALRLGLAAALAAGAKLEGLPLALFLVAAGASRGAIRGPVGGEAPWRRWLALLLPPALVTVPWLMIVARNDLFAGTNWGGLELGRLAAILGAMLDAAAHSLWAGFGLLTLVLMAALWLAPGQRLLAAVLTLQLGFYLFAYLTTPVDPLPLVETSFARLLGHLTPAALVAAILAADRWCREGPASSPSPGRPGGA